MWVYNDDSQRWELGNDDYLMDSFVFSKQELSSTRFYSKFLSGATYVPINTTSDIYDILGKWKPRSWYHSTSGSVYSKTLAPARFATPIDLTTDFEYNTRFLSEYGLTLKNLFTPERSVRDSLQNITEVDYATTETINVEGEYDRLVIDGDVIKKGHLVLVKDQYVITSTDSSLDPQTYFTSNYYLEASLGSLNQYRYYDSRNGIYLFDGRFLVRQDTFDDYSRCVRAAVYVRSGAANKGKQFHLSRLLNGYFPTTSLDEPMEFLERKNWLMRHRVDYNNLFDINYYDVIKHDASQYYLNGITYSIPERTISVGEFGVINLHQNGMTTLVPNKYKVNLRSISMTTTHYWVCGDDATLLKIRKHDFEITKTKVSGYDVLRSVSFYDNLRGVVVGDLNMILITFDGGLQWKRLRIEDFASYTYLKAIFVAYNRIFVAGKAGVFIEIEETPSGWLAYKRRISKFIDEDDENILVESINDMLHVSINNWGLSYAFRNENISNTFDWLILVTDNSNIIAYDMVKSTVFDFLYLDFPTEQGDVINISRAKDTNIFYITTNNGLFRFDISTFMQVGVGNSFSNTIKSAVGPVKVNSYYANEIFDYKGQSLVVSGNNSLLLSATYSSGLLDSSSDFFKEDPDFESRLQSKMLFLNYDMASKLNFFTDEGEYRLPNSVSFDTISGLTNSTFTKTHNGAFFQPNVNPNFMHFQQVVQYDPAKTRGNLKEIRVTISANFDTDNNDSARTALMLRFEYAAGMHNVMSIVRNGQMRPGVNLVDVVFSTNPKYPSISSDPVPVPGKIYRMDMASPPFTLGKNITVNTNKVKDMPRTVNGLQNVDGSWSVSAYDPASVVRKVTKVTLQFYFENSNFYLSPRILPAVSPSYIQKSENNWWTYRSDSTFTLPYYSATLPGDSSKVFTSASFSSYASYSLNFPYILNVSKSNISMLPSDLDEVFPSRTATQSARLYSGKNLSVNTLKLSQTGDLEKPYLYLWSNLAALEVDKDWQVSVGDVIRIESPIVDATAVVNRILNTTRKIGVNTFQRIFIYMQTNFNDNIINDISMYSVRLRNLNRYISTDDLVENFNRHPLGVAYGLTQSDETLRLDAKFNSQTAYYNLATVVAFDGVPATMSYQDSFMKFGYSPTYNILDYLERINKNPLNPTFYYDKEYYSMPHYEGLKMLNPWTASSVYIDAAGNLSSKYREGKDPFNKLVLGEGLRLEWNGIMINTFVDLTIYQPNATPSPMTFSVDRLLVMKKYEVPNYENSGITGLVIEFQKRIDFQISPGANLNNALINIRSRRKLGEISDDLQEMNNIQQRRSRITEGGQAGWTFSTHERELNFKIPTDSYAKVLLSDVDTIESISALFYVDHKNELAMNITKLDRAYDLPISNTSDYNGSLMISCDQKHGLEVGDAVTLEFNGGTASSQEYNQQYFGYHSVVQIVSEYDVVLNLPYGNPVYIGNDAGKMRYLKKDPFLNYQPVDLFEVGSDAKTNISIKLEPENLVLTGSTFSLQNVDFDRYRFKLVDGLTLGELTSTHPWMLDAEVSDAIIGLNDSGLVWYKGVWESGRWFGGTWNSGDWLFGDWYGGVWNSAIVERKGLDYTVDTKHANGSESVWHNGRWYGGDWMNGTWTTGRWYDGVWNDGSWYNGIWNDGQWKFGRFIGGIWVQGVWTDGFFSCDNEPAFWIDGEWMSGDFENGIWYDGIFGTRGSSRFGVNSYNSRTAVWNGGVWKSGSFHSGKPQDIPDVSDVHKYSIWRTGNWVSGDFYGGVAYNMSFNSGTWHGGILEEIQVIGINAVNNSFTLNGVFRFNLGDIIYIIDNNKDTPYSSFGSNSSPGKYSVLKCVVDTDEEITEVYVSNAISVDGLPSHIRTSGELNFSIPRNPSVLSHTLSVAYNTTDVKYIRVRLNLMNKRISDLTISIKSPSMQVMNILQPGVGSQSANVESTNNSLIDTFFTTERIPLPEFESPQTGLYPATMELGVFGQNLPTSTITEIDGLTNYDGTVKGDWAIYIKDNNPQTVTSGVLRYGAIDEPMRITQMNPDAFDRVRVGDTVYMANGFLPTLETFVIDKIGFGLANAVVVAATASAQYSLYFKEIVFGSALNDPSSAFYGKFLQNSVTQVTFNSNPDPQNKLISWEIQFLNDNLVGTSVGLKKSDGIDTGLRLVSNFRNTEWKSGIWTNGIFESGDFRSGIFIDGIFNGRWGS